jgi:DNA-directed RNA polymerase specialized sigma subunit
MARQKLTETKVRRIKKLLLEGVLTKTAIGEMYGVTRSQICKINKGMTDPNHKNSRWSDIN